MCYNRGACGNGLHGEDAHRAFIYAFVYLNFAAAAEEPPIRVRLLSDSLESGRRAWASS